MNVSSFLSLCLLTVGMVAPGPVRTQALDTILVDFGSTTSEIPRWNNVTSPAAGASLSLSNARGLQTAYRLTVTDAFAAINYNGAKAGGPAGYPASATGDSFYGNTATFQSKSEPTGAVTFSSLRPEEVYTFEIYSSRTGTGGDNRTGRYILIGAERDTVTLNAADNLSQTAVGSVRPAADGTIVLLAESDPTNTNPYAFYYLNAVAVTYPFEDLATEAGAEVGRDTVQVDFGYSTRRSGFGWNNVTHPSLGKVADLVNSSGFATGYGLAVVDAFNNVNEEGTLQASPQLAYPDSASSDSFYGNTVEFAGKTQPTAAVEITGLEPAEPYALELFASRVNTTDNRQTMYIIQGAGRDTVYLDAAANFGRVARDTMVPTPGGRLVITVGPGPDNDNAYGFYYLNALRLTYAEQDAEEVAELSLLSPTGGEYYQVGKEVTVAWASAGVPEVVLEYSVDAGGSWIPIDTVDGSDHAYPWTVPDAPTRTARLRISAATLSEASGGDFTIARDTSTLTIVIVGSSTAAGNGASVADSSWVNRYAALLRRDTRFQVVNLARGGYTTYHVQPTGTRNPDTIAIPVDRDRNSTAALAFDPAAIIVNLPSNDGARSFPARDQLANLDRMVAEADGEGVPVWIATTQPRNFSDPAQIALQEEMRDSIFDRYGSRSLDFWNGLADATGHIDPALDKGDGVHVNDGGHRLLFERVAAAGISEAVVAASAITLPVTLTAFSATRTPAGEARLTWQVSDERDRPTYVVQRAAAQGSWQDLVAVAGRGRAEYVYVDADCPPTGVHYRLRIVEQDGSARYSPIRSVAGTGMGDAPAAYPNPTSGPVTVVTAAAAAGTPIRVVDAAGRTVLISATDAVGIARLDLSGLAPGYYTVRTAGGALRIIRR
ncbi:GDSL-type esterase/lipase family protein [Lewinella sp. IMCC34183]|uniref:GDSL-type esterase/lipase family protein n=1 Tax=Lewinella sp. IMCC34183 TaxID=2248762 RepID=UPI000E263E29|nr:GDSL-type esterase/lipase family protein [Lewinella sp. IMCC34183]